MQPNMSCKSPPLCCSGSQRPSLLARTPHPAPPPPVPQPGRPLTSPRPPSQRRPPGRCVLLQMSFCSDLTPRHTLTVALLEGEQAGQGRSPRSSPALRGRASSNSEGKGTAHVSRNQRCQQPQPCSSGSLPAPCARISVFVLCEPMTDCKRKRQPGGQERETQSRHSGSKSWPSFL